MQPGPAATPPPKKSNTALIVVVGLIAFCFVGVPVLGVIAAIAIPGFLGYVRRSKVAEAKPNLLMIAHAEESYCEDHSNYLFPAGPVPAAPMAAKQIGDFDADPTFHTLGVSIPDPIYLSYSITPQGAGEIVITAHGDLDGDGTQSTFAIHCLSSCSCEHEPSEDSPLE